MMILPTASGYVRVADGTSSVLARSEAWQAALTYRNWGWSVFPLYKKLPAAEYWAGRRKKRTWKPFQYGPPDDDFLDRVFSIDRGAAERIDGVGVVLGPASGGLTVRDFDTIDGYLAWARRNTELARRLPTSVTGRGVHVFFVNPGRPVYRRFSGEEKGELIGDSGHYVCLPPAVHPKGMRYEWYPTAPKSIDDFPVLTPEEAGLLPETTPTPAPRDAKINSTLCVSKGIEGFSDLSEAVMRCLPAGPGERNECLWKLARTIKGIAPEATEEALQAIVGQWYDTAKGVIGTKSLTVCWRDFQRQWESALPIGAAFDEAMAAALEKPAPPEVERYRGPDVPEPLFRSVQKLAKVCAALQSYHGAAPFFLSNRTAQRLCGFRDHVVANAWLLQFVADGLLELVGKGSAGSKTARKASEYRWRPHPASPRRDEPAGDSGAGLAA
jgi:hypothetical protein